MKWSLGTEKFFSFVPVAAISDNVICGLFLSRLSKFSAAMIHTRSTVGQY